MVVESYLIMALFLRRNKMSDAQIFQAFSIVYISIGLGIVINREFYKNMFADFVERPATLYLGGLMALVVGYLLVAFHNTWTADLSVIITVLGWMALVKGIVILVCPKRMISLSKALMEKKNFMRIEAIVAIVAGLVFVWLGFCPESPIL